MPMLKNDRLLRALKREEVDRTPVWIMRQAGRYLPEYRAIRAKAGNFMTLCKTPELACEVALQPLARYDLDAAILFSDILTIPDAMGLGLHFKENEGPYFERPIRSANDVKKLIIPQPEEQLSYVLTALRMLKQSLQQRIPVLGFSGSPWTLATYMVEGQASKSFSIIKKMLYSEPTILHVLLLKLAKSVTAYLQAQIKAGADVIMLFDTWGGLLTTSDYQTFSLNYMRQIIADLKTTFTSIPIVLFTKGGGQWLDTIAASGCTAVGLDWTTDIGVARSKIGHLVALQGNMDPAVLYASPTRIQQEVRKLLASYGQGTGHIFNLGHGIHPEVPPEHVQVFVEAVHEYSAIYHQHPR